MRNMNCRNIRREIEAAGSARFLSKATIAHLDTCPACETLSRQQTNLQAIVSSLGTVAAPKDFDYRLRARLAAEKQRRAGSGSLMLGSLSFGLRSGAVAAMLLLIGAAFILINFRTQPTNQVANGTEGVSKAPEAGQKQVAPNGGLTPGSSDLAAAKKDKVSPVELNLPTSKHLQSGGARREVATRRNRVGTYDEALSVAKSLTPDDAFPINTSNQSLRVSVDDRRGAMRTISLPSVSFGSQKTLSQNSSPLLASSRDTW